LDWHLADIDPAMVGSPTPEEVLAACLNQKTSMKDVATDVNNSFQIYFGDAK